MFVPFESMPPASRIWIFQANRPLSPSETQTAEARLRQFTEEWSVHGTPFETSFSIRDNQFIVLAADERQQNASGCSIDSSVRALKDLEQHFGIDLFDRNLVAFEADGKVVTVPLKDLKEKFHTGILTSETLTFNNVVSTKADLDTHWLVRAGETWLRRYIPNTLEKVK
jgi:hypothetical protein